jgi:prophage DNA circulation protein
MVDDTQIINGSFKGVPISIDSSSIEGGRKVAVKQFPSRDTQSVEDLGLLPRKYSLEIIISAKLQQDYFGYRNRVLAAVESKGPGELIHPLYGRVDDVVAVSYSLNENFGSFGDTRISVNFEVNENTGIPQTSGIVVTEIATANDAVQSAINTDIANNFSVTNAFAGNFGSAVDKVDGIIDEANKATEFIGEAAQTLDTFSALIGELSANVNSLVSNPSKLADAVVGLFESVNGLYASAGATFDTMTGFFGFGSDDTMIRQDTAGRIERQNNNDVLNGAVSSASLGYAFLAATRTDFETTREIDELTAELDAQYEAIQTNGSSQTVKDLITDMRVKVLQSLDQTRTNTSQIITVQTNPTTVRLLAFAYYGDDELAETIAELNNISDVSFVEGDVEVLTL